MSEISTFWKWFWVIVIAAVIFGAISVFYTLTVGKAQANADRKVFKQGDSYVEGILDDLVEYKFQYETTDVVIEKKAILNLIRGKFANFDYTKIENPDLKTFLEEVMTGKRKE